MAKYIVFGIYKCKNCNLSEVGKGIKVSFEKHQLYSSILELKKKIPKNEIHCCRGKTFGIMELTGFEFEDETNS